MRHNKTYKLFWESKKSCYKPRESEKYSPHLKDGKKRDVRMKANHGYGGAFLALPLAPVVTEAKVYGDDKVKGGGHRAKMKKRARVIIPPPTNPTPQNVFFSPPTNPNPFKGMGILKYLPHQRHTQAERGGWSLI